MALNYQNAALKISAGMPRQFPRDPVPQAAFSGRSNVGKSSLINTLLGRKALARVSSSPGKTITVNFYDIDGKVFLVDLPGYGYAKRSREDSEKFAALTDGYFTNNPNIDRLKLVVQLVDSRVGVTADDAMMLSFMNNAGIDYIVAATKCDKLNKTERADLESFISSHPDIRKGTPVIGFSAQSGEGKAELLRVIEKIANNK